MSDERWFFHGDEEWAAIAERLKFIACRRWRVRSETEHTATKQTAKLDAALDGIRAKIFG